MTLVQTLKARARTLKHETHALYLAVRDPRTPWYARRRRRRRRRLRAQSGGST